MYRTDIPINDLQRLYLKNDLYASIHLFIHLLFFVLLFLNAGFFIEKEEFSFALMCLLGVGFIGNFFGWSGIGHELLHETVFTNRKINRFFMCLFSIYLWNNWVYHRTSHRIHHQSTMKMGVDYEFDPKQKKLSKWDVFISLLFNYRYFIRALRITVENAVGVARGEFAAIHFQKGTGNYLKLVRAARLILIVHIVVLLLGAFFNQFYFSLIFSLSPFVCNFFSRILALSQHYGLALDNDDPRKTSRSLTMPKWLELFYANMNYHVEHHMYAGIPFYNLPKARNLIAFDLPKATKLSAAIKLGIDA